MSHCFRFHGLPGLLALLCCAGCQSPKTRFNVRESPLNVCEARLFNTNFVAVITLSGTGHCVMRSSNNPAIINPFSPDWHKAGETRVILEPGEINPIFQSLVNAGVCDKKDPSSAPTTGMPYAQFDGKVGNESFYRHTRDPRLLEIAHTVKHAFDAEADQQQKLRLAP